MIGALLAVALAALGPGPAGVAGPPAAEPARGSIAELQRAVEPGAIQRTKVVLGRSAAGRPIRAEAANGWTPGLHGHQGEGPLVLAFGCIHGDECAGTSAIRRSLFCRRPTGGGLVTVRNLNPDGRALGTRLNGRGVDLNRNFATDWRPIGVPGDPEHSGARPFSEPETRLARRLIRRLHPDITIWFHQQAEPLVRAWGPSVPAARAYARLAGMHFAHLPWMDGTAPNWQNDRFPRTSSFVVELPEAGNAHPRRSAFAVDQLAAELTGASVPDPWWMGR